MLDRIIGLLLDLFKIVFTGVFVAYFIENKDFDKANILTFGLITTFLLLFSAFYLTSKSDKK